MTDSGIERPAGPCARTRWNACAGATHGAHQFFMFVTARRNPCGTVFNVLAHRCRRGAANVCRRQASKRDRLEETMNRMPVILSGFLAPTDRLGAIFAAVLIAGIATGSNASQAREQSGPSLRIPESRLAQAAAVMPGVDPSPSGSRASGLRIPPSWLAQANAQRVEEAAERQAVVPSPSGPGWRSARCSGRG